MLTNLDFDITKIFEKQDLDIVEFLMCVGVDQTSALKLVSQFRLSGSFSNFYKGVPVSKIFDKKTYNAINVMLCNGRDLEKLCKDYLHPTLKVKENKSHTGLRNSKYILNGIPLRKILSHKEMNRIYDIASKHEDWTTEQIYEKFQFDKSKHSKEHKKKMEIKQKLSSRAYMFAKRHPELDKQKVIEAYKKFYEIHDLSEQFVWGAV